MGLLIMKRPTITDGRRVVLRGRATGVGEEVLEMTGRANNPDLWAAWAYYTCRHYTSFTWAEVEDHAWYQHAIWQSTGEARQYLVHRAMDGDPRSMARWADLRKRGLVPAVGLTSGRQGTAPMLPASGTLGWGPYCRRCRIALSTTNMEGYELKGGRYYGLCDNCKEHQK